MRLCRAIIFLFVVFFLPACRQVSVGVEETILPDEYMQAIPVATGTNSQGASDTEETAIPEMLPPATLGDQTDASGSCHLVSPGIPFDLSIPDGMVMKPGEYFIKTWRLNNFGTCPWSQEYAVVWFSGTQLGRRQIQYLGSQVSPGDTIDIGIDMVAPLKPGMYQSNWKLRSVDGSQFGIGPNGDTPFWVRIQVIDPRTPVTTISPTASPTPMVYSTGSAILQIDDGLDLDGIGENSNREADLSLGLSVKGVMQLVPKNDTKLTLLGMSLPVEKECRTLTLFSQPIDLEIVENGTYLCYRTQVGLSGYARITRLDLEGQIITIEYLTWAKP